MAAYPEAEVLGSLPEGLEREQAGQGREKAFQYGADAFEEHLRKEESSGRRNAVSVPGENASRKKAGR